MSKDYVPSSDADFLVWAKAWLAYASEHLAEIGVTAAEVADLSAEVVALETAIVAHTHTVDAEQVAKQTRDDTRDVTESKFRAASQRVQVHEGTTDTDRAGLHITIRDAEPGPAPVSFTRPVGTINANQRFCHELRWRDETSGKRAKPAGMTGCEVWVKLGEAPTVPEECRYLATESRMPFVAQFPGEDGGKVAHYMLRWVSAHGDKGPWSETVSAMIQN
jgi:hypothetical protein